MLKILILSLSVLSLAYLSGAQKRIFGGLPAGPGQFPYMVSIQNNGKHHCGGSIVAENIIITAAHCLYDTDPGNLKVLAGTNRLSSGGHTYLVEKYYPHPNYDRESSDNDVGIIILKQRLPLGENNIQKIELVDENEEVYGKLAIASGWGLTGEIVFIYDPDSKLSEVPKPQPSDILQYIKIRIQSPDECKITISNTKSIRKRYYTPNMICGGNNNVTSTCGGDSGGPLVVDNKLAGITSWGSACAEKGEDVYTSVAAVRSWIRQTIQV